MNIYDRVAMLYLLIKCANWGKYTKEMMEKDAGLTSNWIKSFMINPYYYARETVSWKISELEYVIKRNAPYLVERREMLLSNPDIVRGMALCGMYGLDIRTLKTILSNDKLTKPESQVRKSV